MEWISCIAPAPLGGPLYYDEATLWFYLKVGDVYIPVLPKRSYHGMSARAREMFLAEFTKED